jgi:hypothetical protein
MADGVNASIDDLVRRTAGGRQVALVPEMMKATHSVLDKAFSGNRVPQIPTYHSKRCSLESSCQDFRSGY